MRGELQGFTKREENGRYIVSMPLRSNSNTHRHSKKHTICRFLNMERKLEKNSELKADYTHFMNEYINLGHMKQAATLPTSEKTPEYYQPHHPVFKISRTTTKLRVVFNASAKTNCIFE